MAEGGRGRKAALDVLLCLLPAARTRDSADSGGAVSQRRGCYFEKTEGADISEQQELV